MSSCQHFEAAQECSFIRRKSNKSLNKWKFYFFLEKVSKDKVLRKPRNEIQSVEEKRKEKDSQK